jgi:xylose dehydrogenase (NAD/NADP)
MTQAPVRWGFLGAGFIASKAVGPAVHASDGAVLQVVAARDAGRAHALGSIRNSTDYRAVIEADDVDAVYISLTNEVHEQWVLEAVGSGKQVLCEKPLSTSVQSVARIAAAVPPGRVTEALWYRWHPRYARTMALIADGAIGDVVSIDTRFCFAGVPAGNYRLDPARGGGAVLDIGPYTLDAADSAVRASSSGAEPTAELIERSAVMGGLGVDLTVDAQLKIGAADVSLGVSIDRRAEQVFEVIGSAGSLVWPGDEVFTVWHQPCDLRVRRTGDEIVETFDAVDAYRLMIEQVGRTITQGEASVMPLGDSLRLAELLDLVRPHAG